MDAQTPPKPLASESSSQVLMRRDELRSILSSLSHELCRPLISLRAGFDLLLEPTDVDVGSDQKSHLRTMVSLCDDLLRLTHSYLDFASMVQGTRPITWGTYTLGALFAEIEAQFAPPASRRSIAWELCPDNPAATVSTDASRFQQIFGNLASNAIKYTPAGGSVKIHGRVEHDSWSISIVDTGSGIPPEATAKVFEPFYRLPRDEYAGIEGNGLGLTICRELVEQLHGEINLESIVGQGTEVKVRFPLRPQGKLSSSAESAVMPRQARSGSKLARRAISEISVLRECRPPQRPVATLPSPLPTSDSST